MTYKNNRQDTLIITIIEILTTKTNNVLYMRSVAQKKAPKFELLNDFIKMERIELITSKEYWVETLETLQKQGHTDYDIATVITNKMEEAMNYIPCCMELNNCFELYEHVIYQGVDMMITFVDNCQKTANLYCSCDKTNWLGVSLNKLNKII